MILHVPYLFDTKINNIKNSNIKICNVEINNAKFIFMKYLVHCIL